ncbi:uncharacterized protein METZ01_LOCUS298922, partial [marine metagenome]
MVYILKCLLILILVFIINKNLLAQQISVDLELVLAVD